MKMLLLVTSMSVLAVGFAFWLYRGAQVFVLQLGEYSATEYDGSEADRERLARAARLSRRVDWLLSDGSRQNAFYIASRNGAVLIYAHGSPGNALGALSEAAVLADAGYGVLLVDLPGYGASEGKRAWDAGFVESISMAIDFASAQPEIDPKRIGGFGYSNGGCLIARAAAADERLAAIGLLASYSTLADQLHAAFGRRRTPWLGFFAQAAAYYSGVPVSELDTIAALERMTPRPTLILSGGQDRQIPREMAHQLKDAAPHAEMILFEEMGHMDFPGRLGKAYFAPLLAFWDAALEPNGARSRVEPTVADNASADPSLDASEGAR